MQSSPCQVIYRKRTLLVVTLTNVIIFLGYVYLFLPLWRTYAPKLPHQGAKESVSKLNFSAPAHLGGVQKTRDQGGYTEKWNTVGERARDVDEEVKTESSTVASIGNKQGTAVSEREASKSSNFEQFPSRAKSYEEQEKINLDMNLYLRSSGWFRRLMRNQITFPAYPYLLNNPSQCSFVTSNGSDLTLLVSVLTSVRNVAQRAAIRDTWGREVEDRGAKVIFFLGADRDQSQAVQNLVEDESRDYGDIIQLNFTDSYYNLSTKAVSMMRWVSQYCAGTKYVLKTDDDVFLNVDTFFAFLDELSNQNSGMWGLLVHSSRPARDKHSKWYVPQRSYPWTFYPDFIAGPAYLMSGVVVPLLLETAVRMTPFFLEDIFLTGFVAEVAGVSRHNESRMHNLRDRLDPCNFNRTITSHYHPPWELRKRWQSVHDGFFKCRGPKLTSNESIRGTTNDTLSTAY